MNLIQQQCVGLETRLDEFCKDRNAIEADKREHRHFLGFLGEVCNLLRTADAADPDYSVIVDRINQTVNKGIRLGYRCCRFEFMPSFAHSEEYPALEGPHREELVFSHRMKEVLAGFAQIYAKKHPNDSDQEPLYRFPPPWDTTHRPHPLSSPLSRFAAKISCPAPASALLTSIYQARCEISSSPVHLPVSMAHSGTCIALPSVGGYKSRTPMLSYYLLDIPAEDSGQDFPLEPRHAEVGLSEIAYSAAIDNERKLIFVADDSRIKSYAWGTGTGEIYKAARPTHTLRSSKSRGPLAILPGGRFLRAGKGLANVWNIDELETHGADGKARIGKQFRAEDTMRDDLDAIENSAGSAPSLVLTFADSDLAPATWKTHPSVPGAMLCGTDPRKSGDYSFISLDLEHGGNTMTRYLGSGGEIEGISTSDADPTTFLVSADDGYARLYDVRLRLPVLSLAAGFGETSCGAALSVHPDGVPMIFTGAEEDEVIRLWDVRAAKLVYELSTGNNQVTGLGWDSARNVLYASTNCDYMDRNGYTSGYRRAKIPKSPRSGDDIDEENEEADDDDDDYYGRCWPRKAAHAEEYFGHVLDAGEHRIFRYAFKEQPDPVILPIYGDATASSRSYY
ncbi:hypothetical protein DFH08DRAFT_904878 [Mycena albidolilacea]|uniref:Uncharacterized protein n=1 Tax=Mycena albidolilacea TaxID=1033008 RepID=A0AAD6Z024_9AGAR|nr:hypothetical protein DFH08DRAFT_904878 [Mycena albidolilacea]